MDTWPPLAPIPPSEVQAAIPSKEWELYVDAWILLLGLRTEAPNREFKDVALKDESAILFLKSFYLQSSSPTASHWGPQARTLRKLCFLLTRRFLLDVSSPIQELLDWKYLAGMCCCYPSSSALKRLLSEAWGRHHGTISSSLEKAKTLITRQLSFLDTRNAPSTISDIRLLTILASVLPDCGQVLMAGSDFLDTCADAYHTHRQDDFRRVIVGNVYVGLTSLLKGSKPNLSLLLDQLFSLKASAGVGAAQTKKEPTLLSDLICSSDLLARLEKYLSAHPQKRGQDLVSSLQKYQTESRVFHRRYQKQKKIINKGKMRPSDLPASEEMHIHKMSLVTQVQDLFPDLGSGYIARLLDIYNDDPETVVAHLLDDSIPPDFQSLDKSEQLPTTGTATLHDPLPPNSTPPRIPSPTTTTEHEHPPAAVPRRNVFDNDVDLAELAQNKGKESQLRFGRANQDQTADDVLADRTNHATNKAAILSALATFDSDDDERDDTYDVADVGGTIDSGTATATDAEAVTAAENLDMTLFRAYKSSPALFNRDAATRRSQPRASIKRDTGMTDEAIEGWAVMLSRDPRRMSRLEQKMALSAGGPDGVLNQPELPSTSYRRPGPKPQEGMSGSEDEADSGPGPSSRGGARGGSGRGSRGGGRGRGAGGRGRGGAGGAAGDQGNTVVARQRKEENKSSRANHNRRAQRAKKVARAGGMVG